MLAPYRSVLSTPGAKQWSAAGYLARMPISMVSLAIVLLIAGRTGSYALAGTVSAAYVVATSASSPLLARLMDARGQARVLVPAVVVFTAGLGGVVLAVEESWPVPAAHLFAVVAGAAYPPIGACVRARWAHSLGATPGLHTAYSLEAVVDEAVFMTGPVLVTLLVTSVNETLGIVAVVVFAVVGCLFLASLRSTEPPARGKARDSDVAEPMQWRWLGLLIAAALCLGTLFGSTEVVTVAFVQEHGHRNLAGVLLAGWACGSLIAGLVTGSFHWRSSALRRYRVGAVAMACVMLPLPFVHSVAALAVVLFLAGFAISPTLVACMSLVQSTVPASRLTEGITWVSTGLGLGVAPGAAVAGRLIDAYGASTAYALPVLGGVLGAAVAALTRPGHGQGVPQPGRAVLNREPTGGTPSTRQEDTCATSSSSG